MFHFDPLDYLCPSYITSKNSKNVGFQHTTVKTSNISHNSTVHATSA